MDQQGRILHNEGAQYFEVEWRWQDLRTINLEKLAAETGYRYLGRLHELYALQAQHNVLDRLGRIGVPIQPSHSIYFKKLSVKVIEGKNEIPGLSFATTGDMIVAVLRNEKAGKSKHRLLFSDDVRDWLIKTLATLSGAADTPAQLKTNIDKFHQDLEKRSEYSLIVTVKKETAEFQQEEMVGGTPTPKMLNGAIAIELRGVFDPPARTNARIELVFEKI
jgi:hypothetical protein